MQTLKSIKNLINQVSYKDYEFNIFKKGDAFLIQVQFMGTDTDTGKVELQKCRKWYISAYSCDSEVVRSCFLAIRQAEEHELTENFKYKGIQVFNPHLDMDKLAEFVGTKPFQTREPTFKACADKSIVIKLFNKNTETFLGYLSFFSANGGESSSVYIRDALVFKNEQCASLICKNGRETDVEGHGEEYTELASYEEVDLLPTNGWFNSNAFK